MNRDAETVLTRHETPDVAELRRLAEAATPGPWYLDGPWWYGDDDSAYCISTAEDAGRIAVTIAPPRYIFGGEREVRDANARFIAAANPAVVLALLDKLDAAEARLAAIEATDKSKLSIQYGWLTYEVGEHTCGGYGPESGYMHEPGCGYEPLLRLDDLTGWPGEALDAAAERDALAAKVALVREWLDHRGVDASDRDGACMDGYRAAQRHAVIDAAELRAALGEEAQP